MSEDKEKLLQMAREAGLDPSDIELFVKLARFAELVRADEREECAMECIKVLELSNNIAASVCAGNIRARGKQEKV